MRCCGLQTWIAFVGGDEEKVHFGICVPGQTREGAANHATQTGSPGVLSARPDDDRTLLLSRRRDEPLLLRGPTNGRDLSGGERLPGAGGRGGESAGRRPPPRR